MEPQAPSPKQQIVERVRQATNVLVTVSTNPTVDQLAACIGLTLMLNKLDKHATAVFSGQVPSTLEFLKPEETLEKDTNSLRDFIISLDKSKADKLRYKVEEDVVRIFITPYRTSLSQNDLQFSQGDFNVDVVIALGVMQREQLDQAIITHGRILHDATVITISAGQATTELGSINWQDQAASSLSEMLVSISEAFQGGLLDGQIATAFLTGIVAETGRFSNPKTSPRVMTMAAQLMAAGANQQLIATQLQQTYGPPAGQAPPPATETGPDGSLSIHHQNGEEHHDHPDGQNGTPPPNPEEQIHIDEHGTIRSAQDAAAVQSEKQSRRIISPVPADPNQSTLNELLAQSPEYGGTFNANIDRPDEKLEGSSDALSLPPLHDGLLDHSSGPARTLPDPLNNGPELPLVPMPDQPSEPSMVQPSPQPEPPATQEDDSDDMTLLDLERSINSPHINQELAPPEPPAPPAVPSPPDYSQSSSTLPPETPEPPVDSARNAVLEAINAMPYNDQRPEPLQATGANPVDLPLPGIPMVSPSSDQSPAPMSTLPPEPQAAPPPPPVVSEHPSHGLLAMTPPVVPVEDEGVSVDPLAAPPLHADPTYSQSAPSQQPAPGQAPAGPPPPLPPPMMPPGFPMPSQDPNQQ